MCSWALVVYAGNGESGNNSNGNSGGEGKRGSNKGSNSGSGNDTDPCDKDGIGTSKEPAAAAPPQRYRLGPTLKNSHMQGVAMPVTRLVTFPPAAVSAVPMCSM